MLGAPMGRGGATGRQVTAAGEPVLPLDGHGRRPYEVLLLCRRAADADAAPVVPATFTVCSMPPQAHSRKPPLLGMAGWARSKYHRPVHTARDVRYGGLRAGTGRPGGLDGVTPSQRSCGRTCTSRRACWSCLRAP